MATVKEIINDIINVEGGYTDNPNDLGGPTMYGITMKQARASGYMGEMHKLPRETAYEIYYAKYVVAPGFDRIVAIDEAVAAELIDTGVNMGPKVAVRFLQRSLNAVNEAGLNDDGDLGRLTINALNDFLNYRKQNGTKVLLKMLNSLQCVRYIELVESRQQNRTFIYGWVSNRVEI